MHLRWAPAMRNVGKIIVALLVGVLLFIGLTGAPKGGGGGCSGLPQGPWIGLLGGLAVPADGSLTLAEYAGLGAPPPDGEWTSADMAAMQAVLATVTRKGPGRLPRFQSQRSGALFARMTSAGNLASMMNPSVPRETRYQQAMQYTLATEGILKLYVEAFFKRETGDSEVLEMQAATLGVGLLLLRLIDEIEPELKKGGPMSATRLQGVSHVRQGNLRMVRGAITSLTEARAYRTSERIRFIGRLQETVPAIVSKLEPGQRAEVVRWLDSLRGTAAHNDLEPALGQLQAKVKAAAEAAGS